jgi:hypothetical protein
MSNKGQFDLKRILSYMRNQPTCRLTILAESDLETGETKGVEVKRTGDEPPVITKLSDENILKGD